MVPNLIRLFTACITVQIESPGLGTLTPQLRFCCPKNPFARSPRITPRPVPAGMTVNGNRAGTNMTWTSVFLSTVTWHVEPVVQVPEPCVTDQLPTVPPDAGVAVSVTTVPAGNSATHVPVFGVTSTYVQLMPAGDDVTTPSPSLEPDSRNSNPCAPPELTAPTSNSPATPEPGPSMPIAAPRRASALSP